MKHKLIFTAIILPCLGTPLQAQTYTKDVDVTVELQPELRAASRLDIRPVTLSKSFPASSLRYNGTPLPMSVTPMIGTLPPVAGDPIYSPSDYDGYLVAGYYPWADFGVSAGYRLVDTRSTRLEAWTQLSRNRYKEHTGTDATSPRARVATTDFDLGLDFSSTSRYGTLSAATSLYMSHFNYPSGLLDPATQNSYRYRLGAGWHSTLDETASGWALEGNLDWFTFGKACFPVDFENTIDNPKGLRQTTGNIKASGQLMFNDAFGMGLSVGYTGSHVSNRYLHMPGIREFHAIGGYSPGIISIGASFRFNAQSFAGHIGPVIDISTGDISGTHTGARGVLDWNISRYVRLFTTVESGTRLNTLGELYDINRYAAPLASARPSFLNGDVKAGVSVGPFKGFSITARGGFSSAADWALPALADGVSTFATTDLSTAYYSVELKYDRGHRLSARAILEGAVNNDIDHAYYRWNDRASQVLDLSVSWNPLDELSLEGGFELRRGRRICDITSMQEDIQQPVTTTYAFMPLGRVMGGRIGATYNIDETIAIWGRLDGIGQGRYLQAGAMPGQRMHGLVGITLRF